MYPLKNSTAITVPILAVDAAGAPVTGKVDGDWTKRISKNGGAFAAMTVTVTEMELGFYSVPLSTAHTDTNGVLTVGLSATGVLKVGFQVRVVPSLWSEIPDLIFAYAFDSLDGSRTFKGALKRLDALVKGKHTGMLGALWSLYGSDGTTVLVQASQNVVSGTRDAASTVAGD